MIEKVFDRIVYAIDVDAEFKIRFDEDGDKKEKIVTALIDTGATDIYIRRDIIEDMGARVDAGRYIKTANGSAFSGMCKIDLIFGEYKFYNVRAYTLDNMKSDMLIGMSVLNKGNVSIRNDAGFTIFNFEKIDKPLII